jgi:F-type H+-transporting ATPase subunit beta
MESDDMTDPAVNTVVSDLDTTVILSRAQAGQGIYPMVDLLRSSSKLMDRHVLAPRQRSFAVNGSPDRA